MSLDDPRYVSDAFRAGLATRREVLGADYVDASISRADDSMAVMQ